MSQANASARGRRALLLSLLALGALGLVACGDDDDDQTTAASETETTRDEPAADHKSCGRYGRYRFAVEGDVSCRAGRRVMHGFAYNRLPIVWTCGGPDGSPACANEAGDTIRAHARKDVLRRWRAAEAE